METRPIQLPGCLTVAMGLMTLGVAPLGIWWSQRCWPTRLDDEGMTLRDGRRVPWSAITDVVRVETLVNGQHLATRYDLSSTLGTVKIVPARLEQGDAVAAYVWARLPAAVKAQAAGAGER